MGGTQLERKPEAQGKRRSDMAEVRCRYCGKKHALELDGVLKWYCPACKRYQETISASSIDKEDLTKSLTCASLFVITEK